LLTSLIAPRQSMRPCAFAWAGWYANVPPELEGSADEASDGEAVAGGLDEASLAADRADCVGGE